MNNFHCCINSAIISKEQKSFLIPPICYDDRLYILSDKKLYYVLEKIEKLQEYLKFTRKNGTKQTRKWLKKNNLINEGFLENTSRYWIDAQVKKAYKYYFFEKDKNYRPFLSENLFKNYFHTACLNDFLEKNQVAFNIYTEKQLELIEKEFQSIPDLKDFNSRRFYIKNNFYKNIIYNFAQVIDENLHQINEMSSKINVQYKQKIDTSHLKLFYISGVKNYKNSKFINTNIRYKECLAEKTCFDVKIEHSKYDTKNLVEKYSNFTQNKIAFEKKYINKLINNSTKKQTAAKEKFYIEKIFSYIQESNIIFDSKENLYRTVVLLNLEQANIDRLNKLLYGEQNKIYSLVVQSANNSNANAFAPYGYASLQAS